MLLLGWLIRVQWSAGADRVSDLYVRGRMFDFHSVTASNLEQVANLVCAQAKLAS